LRRRDWKSHLGYQASYNKWRWALKQGAQSSDAALKSTPDQWLSWYFDNDRNIKTAQLKFWMQATV
jgi:hypothetical protein